MRGVRLHGVRLRRLEVSTGEVLVFLVVLYFCASTTVYRFRHPEKTETELFLSLPDALSWRR